MNWFAQLHGMVMPSFYRHSLFRCFHLIILIILLVAYNFYFIFIRG